VKEPIGANAAEPSAWCQIAVHLLFTTSTIGIKLTLPPPSTRMIRCRVHLPLLVRVGEPGSGRLDELMRGLRAARQTSLFEQRCDACSTRPWLIPKVGIRACAQLKACWVPSQDGAGVGEGGSPLRQASRTTVSLTFGVVASLLSCSPFSGALVRKGGHGSLGGKGQH
jgi:hypothetical protein